MAELPTGTVTFLLTDIEGSTVLWEQHRDAARAALVRHDALVEQVVAGHGGHVVRPRGEGDSRFAVFARATDAVAAAATLQQALYAELWPMPTPLRVRMALHTGEADFWEGDYYGSAVNRCARLRAVAHGGQTLVSTATQELVRDSLPSSVDLRDLGEQRLKDLLRPERVFQLLAADLPAGFPPLKSLDAQPNNLPLQLTPLVGREHEVAAVRQRLLDPTVRLLTLTGPGGTGKTRLSVQVAAELLDDFADGAWFVDLAPLSDAGLVVATIAQTLGVREMAGQPIAETLAAHLREQHLLLVLDNFEQVLSAASALTALLRAAARVKMLVTSREVLRLSGEHDYPVPPLALPDLRQRQPLERLTQYAAVALFIQRAQAAKPDFQVTNENAPAVAEICIRLDGLPLAIELAAARVRLLPPEALLQRLELKLLKTGARDLPPRQQTIHNAIAWSYDLLPPAEQVLFARLGVFVGGCTLAAAEAVCGGNADESRSLLSAAAPLSALSLDVLDGLASLVDKSLVRQEEGLNGEPRFRMLETIRAYARERLLAHAECAQLQRAHAHFFLSLVADGAPQAFWTACAPEWLNRVTADQDNLQAALAWALDEGDVDLAARLVMDLWSFWGERGHTTSLRPWLERVLAAFAFAPGAAGSAPAARALHARLLLCASQTAWDHGDQVQATEWYQASLALYQALGERAGAAQVLLHAGRMARDRGDYARARRLEEESLTVFREVDDRPSSATALMFLADVALDQGDIDQARVQFQESLALYQQLGDDLGAAWPLLNLGRIAHLERDDTRATAFLEQSLALFQRVDHVSGVSAVRLEQGRVHLAQGDVARAATRFRESLALDQRHQNWSSRIAPALDGLAAALEGTGGQLTAHRQQRRAAALRTARLAGAATAVRAKLGVHDNPVVAAELAPGIATRAAVDAAEWETAWAEGRVMTLEQAVAYALAADDLV